MPRQPDDDSRATPLLMKIEIAAIAGLMLVSAAMTILSLFG